MRKQRRDLAERLEEAAHHILDALPEKIQGAPLKDAAAVLGILVEKMRQLRELPEEKHETVNFTDDERCARVLTLLERGRTRGSGPTAADA